VSHSLPPLFCNKNSPTQSPRCSRIYPFTHLHAALQNQYLIKVAEIKKALQLRGLSVDGLKAELQQCLQDAIDNNAAMTHTKNTAMEGTVNINDNTRNAEHAELPTEPPTHAKKTTTMTVEDVDKMKGKSLISRITCVHYFTKGIHRRTHVLSFSPSHVAPQFQ
jgi:hypothetical protein